MKTLAVSTPTTCVRCGAPLPPPQRRGRTRVFCSDNCRRRAWDARNATGAVEVTVVERVVVREHDITECVRRVKASPVAVRHVLYEAVRLIEAGTMIDDPKWTRALAGVEAIFYAFQCAPSRSRSGSAPR